METIPLHFQRDQDCQIILGNGLLKEDLSALLSPYNMRKMAVITHKSLFNIHGGALQDACASCKTDLHILFVEEGEESKSLSVVQALLDQLFEVNLDRHDGIIAFGGGVIGDLAGFVASIYLRGIRLIQIPSTVLAQVDSAIGGKTGVNHHKGKNLIGSFYQASMTLIDPQLLSTLPKREITAGLAEIIKYGLICHPKLFERIEAESERIAKLDPISDSDLWLYLISESAKSKARIVQEDENETGIRATLNFGHTVAHALESASGYGAILHGESVGIGMKGATQLSVQKGYLDSQIGNRILKVLNRFNFPSHFDIQAHQLIEKMRYDKKNKSGDIRFVLLNNIGEARLPEPCSEKEIITILNLKGKLL